MSTATVTQDKPWPPLTVRSIACTGMLWLATWLIYLCEKSHAPALDVPPHRTGVILSLVSTVAALCIFAYTSNVSRRWQAVIFVIWLAVIFAVNSRVPYVPTRSANTLTFVAFGIAYLKRRRADRRRKPPRRAGAGG